jgi:RimJ/RimL family protein N-acetyltransferase
MRVDERRADAAEAAEERAWVERTAPNGSWRRARAVPAGAAEDVALYRDFLADVSAEDLRLRFFADIAELSAAEGEKLAHLDRHNIVFVGLDEETGQMLGLVRLKEELDEETAEFAIMARSRLKGHGVGWMLMQRAIDYGKEKEMRRIYGDVLAENASMLQMCEELGFRAHDMGSGMKRVVLDLRSQGP